MAIINARHSSSSSGAQAAQASGVWLSFEAATLPILKIKYLKLDCGDENDKVKPNFLNDFSLLFEVLLAPMRQNPVPTPNK